MFQRLCLGGILGALALSPIVNPVLKYSNLEAGVWDNIKSIFNANDKPSPPTIRILIVHNVDGVTLEVKGKYNIYDPYKNQLISSRFVPKGNLMQTTSGGLKWGEEFPGVYQLQITPDKPDITTLVDGIEYRGSIYVYDIGGKISVVNELDIEDYVHSLLSLHVDSNKHEEALAAAAIAARTGAYHVASNAQNAYWHLDAKHAGYQGHAVTGRSKSIEKAVASTRYMIVNPDNGQGFSSGQDSSFASLSYDVPSRLIDEADRLARDGYDAARILRKIQPNSGLALTFDGESNRTPYSDNKDIAEIQLRRNSREGQR